MPELWVYECRVVRSGALATSLFDVWQCIIVGKLDALMIELN